MKAYRLNGIGDLRLEEVLCPEPKAGEALMRVKAVGICGSDIPRVYQTRTYHFPTIPGHEFAGLIEAVGENVDMEWKGKRVGIFPLIPCYDCGPCRAGQYEMCRSYGYLGSRKDDWHYVLERLKDRRITPEALISHRFALEE